MAINLQTWNVSGFWGYPNPIAIIPVTGWLLAYSNRCWIQVVEQTLLRMFFIMSTRWLFRKNEKDRMAFSCGHYDWLMMIDVWCYDVV